jgi:hypothetical protein
MHPEHRRSANMWRERWMAKVLVTNFPKEWIKLIGV